MTHEELRVDIGVVNGINSLLRKNMKAIDAIFELHKSINDDWFNTDGMICKECTREEYTVVYPCPTIEAIKKELQ